MIKPITPSEVFAVKQKNLPNQVIEAFNTLIANKWDGSSAYIYLSEAADLIVELINRGLHNSQQGAAITRAEVFDKGYLDIEGIYQLHGWNVHYEKQCIGDTTASHFIFTKHREQFASTGPR